MLKPADVEDNQQTANVIVLWREMAWLSRVINQVICSYLKQEGHERHWLDIPPPELVKGAPYADLVTDWQLSIFERLGLALAMAPSIKPDTLDIFFGLNSLIDRPFTEFGGVSDKAFSGFIPTGQTLNFLISANNPDWRIYTQEIFSNKHRLMAEQVTQLLSVDDGVPKWAGVYRLNEEWLHYFITGQRLRPELSASFPAHILESPLEWHDLVLDSEVMAQVEELHAWLNYGHKLMDEWQLAKKVKAGYRAVFFGPPGTGKTLTAALLGKATGREVYRVDLSMVVSKYIGETEKNLSRVFDAASYKEWILFFDEGDALFGKRSEVSSSNDRHANQLTGYLLQKIEDFPGTVIIATNLKTNMDEAFTRRFQSMVQFTIPGPQERLQLWKNAFNGVCELAGDVNLPTIADRYEVSGGQIINVLRQCALTAIQRDERTVTQSDIIASIRQEFRKDNKMFFE
ncbi:ATP-binding protein [Mangrovibacter plantisponsor]|uniref:ATPase family protein associated with various cellular activities (AAA) n=1 Tax=Mangrovibacter plantisponsor TaxID=451513 RepID=A0A317Q7E3_9ENTR|nr:ATP-binding protein [Mangrovibacter plantisponsor]PWW11462.1 ATPase family protein associated with various cellular activities (AAA) [Mangrovibacter plantisponsor]